MPRVFLDRLSEDVSRIRKRPDAGDDASQMLDGVLSQVLHLTQSWQGEAQITHKTGAACAFAYTLQADFIQNQPAL